MQIGRIVAAVVTIAVGCAGIAVGSAQTQPAARAPALIRVGHDNIVVDPSLRRYTGVVTALGDPDRNGRIHSFQAKPIGPGSTPPASNEFRGWRLTILAGKRFASVFEVQGNTASEVTVAPRDGSLDGLAVSDVFIIEELGKDPQAASQAGS
jgi:hypothetical protein